MDLSDGLAGDLRHIANASQVGAEILKSALPISRAARLAAKEHSLAKPAALAALTDGEDFELLFTLASQDAVKLLDAWREHFPNLKLTCIGKIVAAQGVLLRDKTGSHQLPAQGYTHFNPHETACR
jgi:thiamine-monophosphate kinase